MLAHIIRRMHFLMAMAGVKPQRPRFRQHYLICLIIMCSTT